MRIEIGSVLKRAWQLTWRFKILWLFGFFAAEAAGGSGGNFNSSFRNPTTSGTTPTPGAAGAGFLRFLETWWPVLVGAFLFLILLGIAFWILSVAARGGIVRLAADADAGAEVRAGNGWSAGFHYWGRVFLQQIVFALPIILIAVVVAVIFVAVLGGSIGAIVSGAAGGGRNIGSILGGAFGLFAGVCGLVLIVIVIAFAIALLYLLWVPLALRYAVLMDRPAVQAIGDGWNLIRSRFPEVALTALTLWALSIALGVGLLLVGLAFIGPAIVFAFAKAWPLTALLFLAFIVVAILMNSVFSAFYSSAWTIAFRRITGLGGEPAYAGAVSAEGGAPGAGGLPEPPSPPAPLDTGAASAVGVPPAEPVVPVTPTGDLGEGLPSTLATQPAGSLDESGDKAETELPSAAETSDEAERPAEG